MLTPILKRLKKPKGLIITALILASMGIGMHLFINYKINEMLNVSVNFGNEFDGEKQAEVFRKNAAETRKSIKHLAKLPESKPFREIFALTDAADVYSSVYDGFMTAGVLVFDANGDGKADLYLAQNGGSWSRPTDKKGVLQEKPKNQRSLLYINKGNSANGTPIYEELGSQKNNLYVKEELLVENYLFPREKQTDSHERVGRMTTVATAVDINNDGRMDLIVASQSDGFFWSHKKTQRILHPFVRPVGREAVKSEVPLGSPALYFKHNYKPEDDRFITRKSARGTEAFAANSVFLNMGDKDGDGFPEWKDASRSTGLEGTRTTSMLLSFDFDRDGDLDVFETNTIDPDFWPGGSVSACGAANRLYVNQLAETGKLTFVESSSKLNVDGIYDAGNPQPDYHRLKKIPFLPDSWSVALFKFEGYKLDDLEINGQKCEKGQISWASTIQDVNHDGYPDLWVANDLGLLRLYINEKGKSFRLSMKHNRSRKKGFWMSLSAADFNGDLTEDMWAGNMGGASMNGAFPAPTPHSLFEPVLTGGILAQQFFADNARLLHSFMDGNNLNNELTHQIVHSSVLPPDTSHGNNVRSIAAGERKVPYDPNSLDPYEFAWGSTIIDIQNDGKPDLYWIGGLYGRGGSVFPLMGINPGRLLVNSTKDPKNARFKDLTAEHQLFNIEGLKYDRLKKEGYVYRNSPRQNWGKRSVVKSSDLSVWGLQGPAIMHKVSNSDMIQAAENGKSVIAADLNGDGYQDIILRNMGGYDSRKDDAVNLKTRINGKVQVISSHDPNYPSPTNFDPGRTRIFLNSYKGNKWLKVNLVDDLPGNFNRNAIGAQVVINKKYIKVKRAGGEGHLSSYAGPLHFGMGSDKATNITIQWPTGDATKKTTTLPGYSNGTLTVYRSGRKPTFSRN